MNRVITNLPFLGDTQLQPSAAADRPAIVVAVLVGAVVVVVTGWMLARALLRPRDVFKTQDKALSRLEFVRSLAGLLITIIVGIHYSGQSATLKSCLTHWALALLVEGVCVAACGVLFLVRSNSPGMLFKNFVRPFLRILLVGVLWLVIPPLTSWSRPNQIMATDPRIKFPSILDVFLVLAVAGVVFLAIGCYCYAARYLYGASEVHPLFGPSVAITTATILMGVGLLPGSANIPRSIYLMMIIGSWMLATILSAKEWRSIKNKYKYGITVRDVPRTPGAMKAYAKPRCL